MHRYTSFPPSSVDAEEVFHDTSTAPTTPDGSLTFSPVLQALKLHDALEVATLASPGKLRKESTNLTVRAGAGAGKVKKICCIGAGYVGGPTAAVIAFQNPHIKVTVVDRDPSRIAQWKGRHLPIYEPGLHEILRIARDGSKPFSFHNEVAPEAASSSASSTTTSECESQCAAQSHLDTISVPGRSPNLFFSTEVGMEIREADIILIAVNTPTKKRGLGAGRATDMTALEGVTIEIAKYARDGAILVEKSTVPCRTADFIRRTVTAHQPDLHFEVLSNPEFLSAATAVENLMRPDRVLIGSERTEAGRRAAEALGSVYEAWVSKERIVMTNTYSSELSKLVSNAMLAQRISSINSISAICEKTGADISEVSRAVGLDPRIGATYLKSGVGFGGSCFRKDILSLCYLAEGLGLHEVAAYWGQVLEINRWQKVRWMEGIVWEMNNTLVGKKVAVLGFAFKGDTDDVRESISLEVIRGLLEDGPGEVAVWDARCKVESVKEEIRRVCGEKVLKEEGGCVVIYAGEVYEACAGADAVVIMTDCDELKMTATKPGGKRVEDPRPFGHLEVSESEVLALEKYLADAVGTGNPLQRVMDEKECYDGCERCVVEAEALGRQGKGEKKGEKADWARIAYHLKKPRWVFDGKGVVDRSILEGLGCKVREIGRV